MDTILPGGGGIDTNIPTDELVNSGSFTDVSFSELISDLFASQALAIMGYTLIELAVGVGLGIASGSLIKKNKKS